MNSLVVSLEINTGKNGEITNMTSGYDSSEMCSFPEVSPGVRAIAWKWSHQKVCFPWPWRNEISGFTQWVEISQQKGAVSRWKKRVVFSTTCFLLRPHVRWFSRSAMSLVTSTYMVHVPWPVYMGETSMIAALQLQVRLYPHLTIVISLPWTRRHLAGAPHCMFGGCVPSRNQTSRAGKSIMAIVLIIVHEKFMAMENPSCI